jgi:signal transduction histidine kinase
VRRRLVVSTIAIVLVVLGALAVPIALVVHDAAERQLDARLDQQADAIEAVYSRTFHDGTEFDVVDVMDIVGPDDELRIIGADGTRLADTGLSDASGTRSVTRFGADGARILVQTDVQPLDDSFRDHVNVLAALALGAVLAAAGLAAVQAFQLARPLERMAIRAGRIGEGDFSSRPIANTNIPEIDGIASALETSARRIEIVLANERHFTADATHQLRTGIAGIAMRLEILSMNADADVAGEAAAALSQTDQLNATIDDLLAAARNRSTTEQTIFDLPALVAAHAEEWRPQFEEHKRHVSVITANVAPPVFGTPGLVGQVIDILLDNSLRHGAGAVTLMIDGPAVVVIDQGPGVSKERLKRLFDGPADPSARHGRGLPLARRLARVDGATLDVIGNHPLRFRFRLVPGDQAPSLRSNT